MNQYNETKKTPNPHSEKSACYNLKPLQKKNKNKKNLKKISAIIIKVSKRGYLGMSKPCLSCLVSLSIMPRQKGYVIDKIYYSDESGNIVSSNISKLLYDEQPHVSRFYKGNNCDLSKFLKLIY